MGPEYFHCIAGRKYFNKDTQRGRERERQTETNGQTDRQRGEKNTQRSLHITNPKAQACAYDYE